jgi:hypothetical protein
MAAPDTDGRRRLIRGRGGGEVTAAWKVSFGATSCCLTNKRGVASELPPAGFWLTHPERHGPGIWPALLALFVERMPTETNEPTCRICGKPFAPGEPRYREPKGEVHQHCRDEEKRRSDPPHPAAH